MSWVALLGPEDHCDQPGGLTPGVASAPTDTVCLAIRLSPPLLLCGPCSMLGVKSLGKLFPLLGYEIFHSLVSDNGEK